MHHTGLRPHQMTSVARQHLIDQVKAINGS